MKRLDTETRKLQIKEAVLDIISSRGLAKLSIKNLAARVGVSEGAIYRHFKSKKQILLSIVDDVYNNLVVKQREDALSKLSPPIKLFTFFCNHITYLKENKGITILLFTEAAHHNDSEMKVRLLKVLAEQKKILKQIVSEGISEGIWNKEVDQDDFTTVYMGIPVMLNIEMVLDLEGFDHKEYCNKMYLFLERALK